LQYQAGSIHPRELLSMNRASNTLEHVEAKESVKAKEISASDN